MVFIILVTMGFILLKIADIINWPWVWVLSPIWIVILINVVVFVATFFYILIRARRLK